MVADTFTHLRLHTEFSISDGLVTIGPLVKRLVDLEMPAVAVTDLANLFGLVKFYSAAQAAGIKPIGGCDVVVVGEDGVLTPLVLLVQSEQGYLNLTQLVSQMYTSGDRSGEPRLSDKDFEGKTEGLIALSGAQYGDIGQALLADDIERAASCLS
ncbi:MAG: PHP domain-containing protein, partial [Pseudohongiellaceae bacterium]